MRRMAHRAWRIGVNSMKQAKTERTASETMGDVILIAMLIVLLIAMLAPVDAWRW